MVIINLSKPSENSVNNKPNLIMEHISTLIISLLIGLLYILNKNMFKKLGGNLADLATKKELTEIEESVKSLFLRDIEEYKVKFNYLHIEKAKVIHQIFYNIKYSYAYLEDYLNYIKTDPTYTDTVEKKIILLFEAKKELRNHYGISCLYLSIENCQKIEEILNIMESQYEEVKKIINEYNLELKNKEKIKILLTDKHNFIIHNLLPKIDAIEKIFRIELL